MSAVQRPARYTEVTFRDETFQKAKSFISVIFFIFEVSSWLSWAVYISKSFAQLITTAAAITKPTNANKIHCTYDEVSL